MWNKLMESLRRKSGCSPWALGLALMLAVAPMQAALVKVFLLGGQSNMDGRALTSGLPTALQSPQADVLFYHGSTLTTLRPGSGADFGPEVTLGCTVADAYSTESFALIKYAVGGTDLNNDWDPATGGTYATFRNTVTNGLAALIGAGHTYEIAGMFWTQGERDVVTGRTAAQYEADLNEFIADVRTRYGADLPFFLSQLSSGQTALSSTGLADIRTAQANVAASDPLAWMIDTDAMTLKTDNLHFDAAGQMDLGGAFGQAFIASVPEPGALLLFGLGGLLGLCRRRR